MSTKEVYPDKHLGPPIRSTIAGVLQPPSNGTSMYLNVKVASKDQQPIHICGLSCSAAIRLYMIMMFLQYSAVIHQKPCQLEVEHCINLPIGIYRCLQRQCWFSIARSDYWAGSQPCAWKSTKHSTRWQNPTPLSAQTYICYTQKKATYAYNVI